MWLRMTSEGFEVRLVPRVGEAVEIHQPRDLREIDDVLDQVRSDETRAAGDEKIHVRVALAQRCRQPIVNSTFAHNAWSPVWMVST